MSLLAPWALWFAATGVGVVALYLLRIRRRALTVPALDFWLQLAGRTKVHSLWERLKRLLSMLLWLAIVACLVLALGNPIMALGGAKPRSIAVIIDNSASMQTVEEGGRTRLDLAREAVERLTTGRPVTDRWLLIEAAAQPRVLQSWTIEGKPLRRAAASLSPFRGSGDLAPALELASQLLGDKAEPTIVVISDGASGTLEPLAKADQRIVIWPVGRENNNLGITRLTVRPHRQHGNYHALVSIVNASDEKIDTQLALDVNDSAHSIELVEVGPGAVWEKTVIIDAPGGGILRASIERDDALAVDNQAFAVLEPLRPVVVWLVTPPDQAFFFEQALASMEPLVWAEESLTLSPEAYESAAKTVETPGAGLRRPDVVVFNNCAPQVLPGRGRFVFANAWPKEIPATIRGQLGTPQLFLSPRKHALTQHLSLQGVRLARAHAVTLTSPARVLAHSAEGDPLVFLVEQADREALCLAFDVLESDMPFRNAFPLLLRNAIAHMQSTSASWTAPEFRIGDVVEPGRPLPDSVSEVRIAPSAGSPEQRLPVQDHRFRYTGSDAPAALRIQIGDEIALAAINLADAGESRISPIAAPDPGQTLALSGGLLGVLPWIGFAALACVLVTLEWLTFHMRWTE